MTPLLARKTVAFYDSDLLRVPSDYLSKFLPRLSEVVQPLREMTAKGAKFIWSPQHETAFQEVRELVVRHPVLKYYDLQEEVTVQCDAGE